MAPISQLQKDGFGRSTTFTEQVNGIVIKEALYKSSTMPDLDQQSINALANVIRAPASYGFPQVIVSDVNWDVTYDVWAADPPAQDDKISGLVNLHFHLLTGFNPPPPPAP